MSTHEHPDYLGHHFETPQQQYDSSKLGMWLFLATEILLFAGLFCAYSVYRSNHPEIFVYAHQYLDKTLGGINTLVLICSSLTMAWAVRCAQTNQRRGLILLLSMTLLFACCFLGIKYVEYEQKWKHGLLWGKRFHPHTEETQSHEKTAPPAAVAASQPAAVVPPPTGEDRSLIEPAPRGPAGLAAGAVEERKPGHEGSRPSNVQIFFGIYFLMTGLHGLHVIGGMTVIGWLLVRSVKGDFTSEYFTPVDLGGLYWHLVDLIWIYLFPLLYLIG